jgi:hypothetical protein
MKIKSKNVLIFIIVIVIFVVLLYIRRRTSNYSKNDFNSVLFDLSLDSKYSTRLKALSNFYSEKDENKLVLNNSKVLKPGERIMYYYTKDKSIKFVLEPVSDNIKSESISFDFKPPNDGYIYNINTIKMNDKLKNQILST